MSNTGSRGICKISSDCPRVEEQARHGIDPTVCGYFQLTTPIVCCEQNEYEDGEYQSPSKPQVFTKPSFSFSSEENDNKFSNNQDNGIVFGIGNKPTYEYGSSNVYPNTFQLYPEDTSVNNENGDSIIYPNDIDSNNNAVLRKSEASKCKTTFITDCLITVEQCSVQDEEYLYRNNIIIIEIYWRICILCLFYIEIVRTVLPSI